MKNRRLAFVPAVILPALLLAPAAAAQYDSVELVDGSTLSRIRITSYTYEFLSYKEGSSEKQIDREKVYKLIVGQTRAKKMLIKARSAVTEENFPVALDEYFKAAEKAAKIKAFSGWLPQVAYWEAYLVAIKHGTVQDRNDCMISIQKQAPKTGFYPEIWSMRVHRAFSAGNSKELLSKAKDTVLRYKKFAKENLSSRYQFDAEIFLVQARLRLKEINGKKAQDAYLALLPKCEGRYADLSNRLNLEIARAALMQGNNDEARKLFSKILSSGVADDDTMAAAYLGRGYSWLRKVPLAKEDARVALSNFMHVAVLYPNADVEIVGESLCQARQAYKKWLGPAGINQARLLYTRLRRNYGESSWAKSCR